MLAAYGKGFGTDLVEPLSRFSDLAAIVHRSQVVPLVALEDIGEGAVDGDRSRCPADAV